MLDRRRPARHYPMMTDRSNARDTGRLVWIAAFVLAAFVFATQEHLARHWSGGPLSFGPVLLAHSIGWGVWAFLTPLVVAPATRRFALTDRDTLLGDAAAHLLIGIVLAALQTFLVAAITAFIYYGVSPLATRDIFLDRTYTALALNILVYAILVAVLRARALAVETRARERASVELEARAARAELTALSAQLQPHFLFNSLNSIAELTHSDPARAATMIRALAALLRRSLANAGAGTTTLSEELAFVERYIELQRMRFPALTFDVRVDDAALDALVPPLLLQPLIENAIRHSVGARGVGRTVLAVARHGDRLHIDVSDDGTGFTEGNGSGSGVGLPSTRARLERLYGSRYTLALANVPAGGARVSLELPYITSHATLA
jgi:sensor histidine kinase YesM